MLERFKIKKLFGLFDYDLDFKNLNHNLVFISGPNGYGKTTILNLIVDIINAKFENISLVWFNSLELSLDDKTIKIQRDNFDSENMVISLNDLSFDYNTDLSINELKSFEKEWRELSFDFNLYRLLDSKILDTYLESSFYRVKDKEKIEEFNSLISKFELQRVDFHINDDGYVVCYNKVGDENESNIHLLSIGEKRLITQIYLCMFLAPENSVVLIDEPELHLHISFQLEWFDIFDKIAKDKNLQIIVATHSPEIFRSKWNLNIDLFTNNENKK